MTKNIADICSAVKKIAWGFLLLLLDFNIMTVNVLPDWIGYIMIVSSLGAVIVDEDDLRKLHPVGIILVVWNIIEWVADIFGVGTYLSFVAVVPMILNIYYIWQLFGNLADIADKFACPQVGKILGWRVAYIIVTIISSAVSYVSLFMGGGEIAYIGGLILFVPGLILVIYIIAVLFSFSRALEEKSELPVYQTIYQPTEDDNTNININN